MATQEFYIRNESDTEARGPFNLEQLSSLVDSGQVTPATLFYDATTEEWTAVEASPDLKNTLFPEKKKLTVRAKQQITNLNQAKEDAAPITVDDMLAAAEGRTADTKDKKDTGEAMAQAAAVGRWAGVAALVLAAAGEILPAATELGTLDPALLLAHPLLLLGAVDLLLAVVLALGVVGAYPYVRFRAALGLGFAGFILWTHGQVLSSFALVAGCVGLYGCTVFVTFMPVILTATLAIGGFAYVGWQLLSS
jgi:hypothetical protein